MYSSSSSLLSVSGGTNSKPIPGSYAFQMTAYVSGAFTGLVSNDTSPEVTASNNTIQITVDGTQSGSVTVPAAHYTSEAALATAIQTAINADSTLSGAGKSVVVTHANGSYSIKSGSIGTSSSMVINAIGSNLDGFLKFVGSTDVDNIGINKHEVHFLIRKNVLKLTWSNHFQSRPCQLALVLISAISSTPLNIQVD